MQFTLFLYFVHFLGGLDAKHVITSGQIGAKLFLFTTGYIFVILSQDK